MTSARVLMCPPSYFDVHYQINPWMLPHGGRVVTKRAWAQWRELQSAVAASARVVLIDPRPGLPDMCFAANAGLVLGDTFVPSRFLHAERRGEEAHYRAWFEQRGFSCKPLPEEIVFEGAGDALFDHTGTLWVGFGQRSNACAADLLSRLLDVDVVRLRLVDPRFYHLDTCFCPLASGAVIYFPGAFDGPSLRAIEQRYPSHRRIAVSAPDACAFACNAVDLGTHVVVNAASNELRNQFAKAGVAIQTVPLGEFLKSGGSAKCLVLQLPGGAAQPSRNGKSHATQIVQTAA